MQETAESLRRLIAQYQDRLSEGATSDMVIFCIQAIRAAEQKLAEIEGQQKQPPSPAANELARRRRKAGV
jgi:F420-0:gamma-glutamyl ligase